ncbi:aminotransferase class I/II-fold pyridoxal phosphate-dependent enzyme [Bacillaceae bacterium SIJ1]|uniref:trans-sulfuration enzyme family protein n=1 Tax=Litoribacterium kuwaitense TaxID=1398745 RepID=UPI0013EC2172|nr:aminotransferase class I/II-fold pyridoxal phosphate-dependent enzyme [Litoribacterium kuwaitense]NGP46545.1 aminotransferase class I/II-fold pyridoxal phosphate-dependent enzyme [Litoribacterium kuwaitense]
MAEHFETKVVQSTLRSPLAVRSKTTPIYQTSAFSFENLQALEEFYERDTQSPYLYTRVGNPNTDELAQAIAHLENAEEGASTATGLAAILAGVLAVAEAGDHIVATQHLYGGTYQLFAEELKKSGISVSFVDFLQLQDIEHALQDNTVLLYSESITNPLLRVEPIADIAKLAKRHKLTFMVDNTFATPQGCRPISLGADIVVHSATKYIGGHSDVTAGVIAGKQSLMERAKQTIVNLGLSLSPFEAWLACRGLKTLSVRMDRQTENAKKLAFSLAETEGIASVYHPAIEGNEQPTALVTIALSDDVNVDVFFQSLGWIKLVATLAGVQTTVSYPILTSHRALSNEMLQRTGVTDKHVRISVGIEHIDDIVSALTQAVTKAIEKS